MRKILAGLCLAVVALSASFVHGQEDNKTKIIGVWKIVKSQTGAADEATVEFTKDGKVSVAAKKDAEEIKFVGSYAIDGQNLNIKIKFGNEEMVEKLTIKELTAEKLVTVDSKGKSDEFKKVK